MNKPCRTCTYYHGTHNIHCGIYAYGRPDRHCPDWAKLKWSDRWNRIKELSPIFYSVVLPFAGGAVPAMFLSLPVAEYFHSMSIAFFQVFFIPLIGLLFFAKRSVDKKACLLLASIELLCAIACWSIAKAIG